jgi:hypothetical protein
MVRAQTIATNTKLPTALTDIGYCTKEYADHVVTVCYKDEELAAYNQSDATMEEMTNVAIRHLLRTAAAAGVTQ